MRVWYVHVNAKIKLYCISCCEIDMMFIACCIAGDKFK